MFGDAADGDILASGAGAGFERMLEVMVGDAGQGWSWRGERWPVCDL